MRLTIAGIRAFFHQTGIRLVLSGGGLASLESVCGGRQAKSRQASVEGSSNAASESSGCAPKDKGQTKVVGARAHVGARRVEALGERLGLDRALSTLVGNLVGSLSGDWGRNVLSLSLGRSAEKPGK